MCSNLTAYLVDVDIIGLGVVTDGVATEPLHSDQGGVVPLAKENQKEGETEFCQDIKYSDLKLISAKF